MCRFVALETPIELRADPAGSIPDINAAFRAPDGRFYSVAWGAAEVATWSPSGVFVTMIGREGRGPGEFARGGKSVHFDDLGRVFVRDNNMRWSVFSANHQLLKSMSAAGMGFDNTHATFVGHSFITAEPVAEQSGTFFHVYEFPLDATPSASPAAGSVPGGPSLVRSFATLSAAERTLPYESRVRLIAAAGTSALWAGPPRGAGRGYEIEKWSLDGTRVLTFRRDVAWLSRGSDRMQAAAERSAPPPSAVALHDNGDGLLFVAFFVPNSRWGSSAGLRGAARDSATDSMADIYFDVVDTNAGVLIASLGPLARSRLLAEIGDGFIPGSSYGFRLGNDRDGLSTARILQYQVVSK